MNWFVFRLLVQWSLLFRESEEVSRSGLKRHKSEPVTSVTNLKLSDSTLHKYEEGRITLTKY